MATTRWAKSRAESNHKLPEKDGSAKIMANVDRMAVSSFL
jgi:hypothetical protein